MRLKTLIILFALLAAIPATAQNSISFNGITFPLGDSWSVTGNVFVNPLTGKHETVSGNTVLFNFPDKKSPGKDLYSSEEFGSFDLSFDFLMFPGSNSGVYLHGNYEIQLRDSWGVENPTYGDNGGVYERWTDQETGYEGRPPMQNASRAPGAWQHMDISFTAPEFDNTGKKIANARVSVVLNGVPVQTDVELTGPTRGNASEEKARGPLRLQGDHGAVAFRAMSVTPYDNPKPVLSALNYTNYTGAYIDEPDYSTLTPVSTGALEKITPEIRTTENNFLLRFTGTLEVSTAGNYTFAANFPGGNGTLLIDGKTVIPFTGWNGEGSVALEAGKIPFEFRYAKTVEWVTAALSVRVSGPGIRMMELADPNNFAGNSADPIYLDAPNVLRSFMDIPEEGRVVRAVSVGSLQQIHYTYDMDNGALVHAWRGEFLNTTPMWLDRGDGSSRPRGAITYLDGRIPPVQPQGGQWKSDTTGLEFHLQGYQKTNDDGMTFKYSMGNNQIDDHIKTMADGKGITRTINVNGVSTMLVRLGHGEEVSEISKGMYRIAGKGNYFIKLDDSIKPEIRMTADGEMELLAPAGKSLTYSILF